MKYFLMGMLEKSLYYISKGAPSLRINNYSGSTEKHRF